MLMKTPHHNWLLLISSVTLLTGCAFTKEKVAVSFQTPVFKETATAPTAIGVQKLKDARGVDPHLLAHKGVQMKTTGEYNTDAEVADIVTDALKTTLKSLNYKIASDGGGLTLSGDIVKFDSNVIMGFWAGAMESSIQLNLKLNDAKTGALLWSELLSGYTKVEGLQMDRAAHRQRVAEEALQDVMKKLGESETFRKVVQNFSPK